MLKIRSIFGKYIGTFFFITLLSFALLTTTITAIVDSYGYSILTESLENAALSAVEYIKVEGGAYDDISEYVSLEKSEITTAMKLLASNDDTLLIIITDQDGSILHYGGAFNQKLHSETKEDVHNLPEPVLNNLKNGEYVHSTDDMSGFFNGEHSYYGIPMMFGGEYKGAVIASSNRTDSSNLTSAMIRTVFMSVLWIMLAALVAVYFISDKLTSPLKDMSRAAKRFANGQFDARVTVVGSDEIAELALAFNNMASSLQSLEDMRRTFLANISHDLRTPMTTIAGFIDGILDGAIPPEKHEYYLGVIASEVKRLSRLVSQLLDISRIEAGERKFNMQPYDICEQAREIIIGNIQRLEDKNLEVSFDADKDNILVEADKDAIHQILYNICDNAIKFSKEGGAYKISIEEKDKQVFVSVYNEGQGIPEEDLPFVFERFYKSDKSRGIDKTGVGLGMYIARTIIEAHGQKISVESEYGKWCRFTFSLKKAGNKSTQSKGDLND